MIFIAHIFLKKRKILTQTCKEKLGEGDRKMNRLPPHNQPQCDLAVSKKKQVKITNPGNGGVKT